MKSTDETAAKKTESGKGHKKTRFRIVKLEQRIAPAHHGGTNSPRSDTTYHYYRTHLEEAIPGTWICRLERA